MSGDTPGSVPQSLNSEHHGCFNFSAGPATLPAAVISRIREDLSGWRGTGVSPMELSHRGEAFMDFAIQCEARLRQLADIPEDYAVLFLQGGATQQFTQSYRNLAGDAAPGFVVNGHWGRKARRAADQLGPVYTLAESEPVSVPEIDFGELLPGTPYVHLTSNETVDGVQFHRYPRSPVPVVADMSSDALSRPLDISRFGMVYASAQKNLGPAGLTLVIIHRDLLERHQPGTPDLQNYARQAAAQSMLNTPPTFAWYVTDLVFRWIESEGGLLAMEQRNSAKSRRLYRFLDSSEFYSARVEPESRSVMNVTFELADSELMQTLLERSEEAGFIGLKGHRVVGGLRASLYNAVPMAWVEALCDFLDDFEQRYG